jgi:glycosyltransferase involved in cell wall biosynthesis
MIDAAPHITILHGKFNKYLSWSQPFLYQLIQRLGEHARNIVICQRTENLVRFPTRDLYRIHTGCLADEPRALLASAAAGRRWNPQLLHAHFGWSGIRMAPMRQFLRVPLVTTFGGRDVGHEMDLPLLAPLYRVLLEISELMICVSEDLKRQLVARGAPDERVVVIHRGTDLEWFQFVDRSQRDQGGPVHLLMVGRLVEKKGHRYALRAVHKLIEAGDTVHLTVVGDGDELEQLLDLRLDLNLAPHVDFVGSTDAVGVRDWYRRADILLHPSVTASDGNIEGLPNTVVEAAATGLPVVATRHGGIAEAVQHERTGIMVDERDVEGLAAAVQGLAQDRQRRLMLGRSAAEFARDRFDIGRQVSRHLDLYREVVEANPADAPRMRRTFLDQRHFEGLRRAIRPGRDDTIVAQIEELSWWWAQKRGAPAFRPPSSSRLSSLRGHVVRIPELIRRPVRRLLGAAVRTALQSSNRQKGGDKSAPAYDLRSAVLGFVDRGGDLEEVDPNWDAARLAEFLRSRCAGVPGDD